MIDGLVAPGRMTYRFGDFSLDADARQLFLSGQETHLTPKAFELLQFLIENRDRAVSKAQMQERLWPSTFVEETNLASLVAEIRRALRDHADDARFIRTVYGFGYRFIAPVTANAAAGALDEGSTFWLAFEHRQVPLMDGPNVIGRAADAAIRIDAPSISRYHARIRVGDREAILEDLDSKNGTQLNGRRVREPALLRDGDEILLGAVALTFRMSAPANSTDTLSVRG